MKAYVLSVIWNAITQRRKFYVNGKESFRPCIEGMEPRELPAVRALHLTAIVHTAKAPVIAIEQEPAGWVPDYYTFDHGTPPPMPTEVLRDGWYWTHRVSGENLGLNWISGPDGWNSRVTVLESAWTKTRGPGGSSLKNKFPEQWSPPLNYKGNLMTFITLEAALTRKLY